MLNYNVLNTLTEMLTDRTYQNIDVKDNTIIATDCIKTPNNKLLVYIVFDIKISIKKMKQIKSIVDENDFNCLIIVYKESITSFAKQFLITDINNLHVQIFSEKELMFNITKHSLNPKFRLLDKTETQKLLLKYKCKSKNLPFILMSDPISKYYGALQSQVFEITRPSPTAGTYISYRIVV